MSATRLTCRLVRLALPWYGRAGVPGWVWRHFHDCEGCKAEAEAYQRLAQAMAALSDAEGCAPAWESVRAGLVRDPMPRVAAGRIPALAAAGICLLALAAAGVWLGFRPEASPPTDASRRMVKADQAKMIEEAAKPAIPPKPAGSAVAPRQVKPAPVSPGPVKPRQQRIRIVRPNKRHFAEADSARDEPRRAGGSVRVAIAPEEHVIDVVGLGGGQDERLTYVIDEITPGGAGNVTRVPL